MRRADHQRDSLAGLVIRDGAQRIVLDLLPAEDAVALLTVLIGPRATSRVADLAALCARLPLALRVAAELAVSRPGDPIAGLVEELADEQERLNRLDPGGDPYSAVKVVLSWSLQHLSPPAARLFAQLGRHPGRDTDVRGAAAPAAAR